MHRTCRGNAKDLLAKLVCVFPFFQTRTHMMDDHNSAPRRTQRKSKSDVVACSKHPYKGASWDHCCSDCKVRCNDQLNGGCGQWKKALLFSSARQGPKMAVGLWRSRCKECESKAGEGIFCSSSK